MRKNSRNFSFYTIELEEYPYITKPLSTEQLRTASFEYFNKDSFDLTQLERLYYLNSDITINENPNRAAAAQNWIYEDKDLVPLHISHSYIYTRYAYAGDAREQIRMYSRTRPEIKQLLNIRPIYGISLNVYYMDEYEYGEIINISSKSRTKTEIYKEKNKWEDYLINNNLLLKFKNKIN